MSENLEELELLEAEPSTNSTSPEPGDSVEVMVEAGGEVIRAADLSYIDEVVDATTEVLEAPKPKKVKIPVVQDERFPAPVKVEALVFRARMKNSQSVRMVQAALVEQGYAEASDDVQGWLCEGTRAALARFQVEHGLAGDGTADKPTIAALFDGSATHYWER
jgi:peptidoglycan hydrolase-like protein with peptidoglycan-binding domain